MELIADSRKNLMQFSQLINQLFSRRFYTYHQYCIHFVRSMSTLIKIHIVISFMKHKASMWSVVLYAPYTIIIQWPTRFHCIETARSNHNRIHLSTVQQTTGCITFSPLQYIVNREWFSVVVHCTGIQAECVGRFRCVTYSVSQSAPFLYCSIIMATWICALNKWKQPSYQLWQRCEHREQFTKSNNRPTDQPTEPNESNEYHTNERREKKKEKQKHKFL